ncbi:MAG: hypothetical protein R3C97_19490 [Geminicoccaceae bacterium]
MPERLIVGTGSVTAEERDALWFGNKAWDEITWDDWERHPDAIYTFTPEAFVYDLPSVLCLSAENPDRWFWPADSLVKLLDRSPVPEFWDEFLLTRMLGLNTDQYEILKKWLLLLAEHGEQDFGDSIGRAFDTVVLLQSKSASL